MFKAVFIFILASLINACSLYPAAIRLPEDGSYEMLAGSKHGCDSALSSRGNSFYRTFFRFKQDPYLIENTEYFDSWYRGYIYCFHVINARAFSAVDAWVEPEHSWFWNRNEESMTPAIPKWPWAQGAFSLSFPVGDNAGIKLPGQGENAWDNFFVSCKAIWQCPNE